MNWRTNRMRLLMPGLILAIAGGCIEREGRPVNPCTQVTIGQDIAVNNVDKVDLLFLVDNSGSMSEEQASLTAELENMVRVLTTGDFNGDGDNEDDGEFTPVKDLNVGVITSDMGTGDYDVPTCSQGFGDDGILRTQGGGTGCEATYPSFLNFTRGDDPAAFAAQVACVASAGTGGCGFEQQLEALLKAVTPTAQQPWNAPDFVPVGTPDAEHGLNVPFFQMSGGNADDENAGFFREDAVLALIPVTDEEDCSVADPEIFNPDESNPTYPGVLNLRCFDHKSALHPISRYVHGLLQARARPNLLIYAPITGIPVDLVSESGSPNYAALISEDPEMRDPRMQEVVDPSMPSQLTPSCNVPGRGLAFPPIRLVQTAQALEQEGAGVTVQSICQDSYEGALEEIIRQIASALNAACLSQPLNREADGTVKCEVVAEMPPGTGCYEGSSPKLDEDGNPVMVQAEGEEPRASCIVTQHAANGSPPDESSGWYYDDFTEEGRDNCGTETFQRIAFINEPPPGAIVRLECFLSVQGDGTSETQIGTFCDPDNDTVCAGAQSMTGANLSCDPISRACGITCEADTDCREAGLVGYVCDKRPLSEIDDNMSSMDPHNYCVNPTCG